MAPTAYLVNGFHTYMVIVIEKKKSVSVIKANPLNIQQTTRTPVDVYSVKGYEFTNLCI